MVLFAIEVHGGTGLLKFLFMTPSPVSKFNIHWILRLVQIGNIGIQLLWRILHLLVSMFYVVLRIVFVLESYLISSGLWKKYKAFNTGKVRYLAIVVESEEAYQTSRVIKLLLWLEAIGVKHICLYDAEGDDIRWLSFKHLHSSIIDTRSLNVCIDKTSLLCFPFSFCFLFFPDV